MRLHLLYALLVVGLCWSCGQDGASCEETCAAAARGAAAPSRVSECDCPKPNPNPNPNPDPDPNPEPEPKPDPTSAVMVCWKLTKNAIGARM